MMKFQHCCSFFFVDPCIIRYVSRTLLCEDSKLIEPILKKMHAFWSCWIAEIIHNFWIHQLWISTHTDFVEADHRLLRSQTFRFWFWLSSNKCINMCACSTDNGVYVSHKQQYFFVVKCIFQKSLCVDIHNWCIQKLWLISSIQQLQNACIFFNIGSNNLLSSHTNVLETYLMMHESTKKNEQQCWCLIIIFQGQFYRNNTNFHNCRILNLCIESLIIIEICFKLPQVPDN